MTIFDLKDGDTFLWRDGVYLLLSLKNSDYANVICLARQGSLGLEATHSSSCENFNPYAEVEKGELKLVWKANI